MVEVFCPFCGNKSMLMKGASVYPHRPELHDKYFYVCKPCQAYVGCHPGTTNPLGGLANKEMRVARMRAHAAFDPLWTGAKQFRRLAAYEWLAEKLGIDVQDCHIGRFDIETCMKVVAVCTERRSHEGHDGKKAQERGA